MKVAVTRSGLKATTREHGLTEYWSHRITHCSAPSAFPRVFCWVYRHEGRKLKQELRCHAVLCAREDQARRMAQQLTERLALALLEFRRDKQSREQARLSLANALHDNPSLPQRKLLLSTGASNYRPPLERSKSAPKLSSIEEAAEEDESGGVLVFGHPHAVARFLREERLAGAHRQRFRESLRRKLAARLPEEPEPEEPDDPFREDPRRETLLTVVRVNSIEEQPDPDPPGAREREREPPLLPLHPLQAAPAAPAAPAAAPKARTYLLDAEDAVESDEGSSSLQSISSDGATSLTHSHSRTDSGEDFCLGADALKTAKQAQQCLRDLRADHDDGMVSSWEGAALAMALAARAEGLAEADDFDDNVSDESGYVEAPSDASEALHHHALALRVDHKLDHRLEHKVEHSLAKACTGASSLRQGLQV
ncbi:Protein FAM43A [Frankliniella fusca]|uniref:Protein FAM43A n=1 Tax=Frankliniella fusca TaxID=407009 RepID=A0AAE1LSA3_9NEOP|nr:Protein FAM43A [Frankliniella fusca]